MIAVIFEAEPRADRWNEYFDLAADLRPLLDEVEGFISVERFSSLARPGKVLSLSFWRDEAAIRAWRDAEVHRLAQAAGRDGIFADYRLRVAAVVRDYGLHDRAQAPADSLEVHDLQPEPAEQLA